MTILRTRPHLRRGLVAAAAAVALPFTLAACGDGAEDLSEKTSEELAEKLIEEGGNGNTDVELNDLPDGFPEGEVPIRGDVTSGVATETPEGTGWSVTTTSDKSVEAAFAEAKSALLEAGFAENVETGGTTALLRGEKYGVTLVATDSGGPTTLGYTVVPSS
ncbi:hypothetical protein ASE01_07300 [Nocardioides sp. Root190]|uniref:hypothetical protein n=1 Tax=Nocardioides sp. Root190 TaxID=1736488 RepID=UPI0006FC9028|nr:hypothetical protein [Nocardioides sp. Root190]KRB77975.1 hypothetical protein ASE01_07300 [Nocardioides sp. Root190]